MSDLFGAPEPTPEAAAAPAPGAPYLTMYVHFETVGDLGTFAKKIGLPLTTQTRWLGWPPTELFPDRAVDALAALKPDEDDDEGGLAETKAVQDGLFGNAEWWEELWKGMPEFDQKDLAPRHSIQVDFKDEAALRSFEALLDQKVPNYEKRTPSIWFPEAEIGHFADKRYAATPPLQPKYPIFIISRGRWESRHTSKALERMGVPYRIVVEPAQEAAYASVIDPKKILLLPFDTDGTLGATPARNFCWETAVAEGSGRHWVFDDNIDGFFRLNRNLKTPVADGTIFRAAEEFVDRYENVGQAGFHYFMFASRKSKVPPLTLNTRVYSCMLLANDLPFRFRGRFNDDTDMSLRILKSGRATVLFSAFLAFKMTTMSVKGGLADTLYKIEDARKKGSEALRDLHPDVTKVTWKWGRWHHHVDYKGFRSNRLTPRAGLAVPEGTNDFGMRLIVDAKKVA